MALRLLKDAFVSLEVQKWDFSTNTTSYSSHIIRPDRREVANDNIDAIRDLQTATTVTELRSHLRLCNVVWRFIPNVARLNSPLLRCLNKEQANGQRPLEENELQALDTLKAKLISPVVLLSPKPNGHHTLHKDAYETRVECVLLQNQETEKYPDRSNIGHEPAPNRK